MADRSEHPSDQNQYNFQVENELEQFQQALEQFKSKHGTDLTIETYMYLITKIPTEATYNEQAIIQEYIDTRFYQEIIRPRIEKTRTLGENDAS